MRAFVKEVNRGRVVRLRSITRPKPASEDWPTLQLPGATTLEAAAHQLLDAPAGSLVTVLARSGGARGVVSMDDVMRGMLAQP